MRLTIVAVGSLKEDYFRAAAAEYLMRLAPYAQTKIVEISESKVGQNASLATLTQARSKEGELILKAIPVGSIPIALVIEAVPSSSLQSAAWLEGLRAQGHSHICFIIGGSFGPLTLPHQLARIVLLEQVYRAFKILRNEPYHK